MNFVNLTSKSSGEFLKFKLRQMPKNGYGEARKIAQHLRVSSTYLSQVLNGSKRLSPEHALKLGRYLGFDASESEYFLLLVQKERAGDAELRSYFQEKIDFLVKDALKLAGRVVAKKKLSEEEKSIFYSNPVYSAIHIYCATAEGGRTVEEIAQRFALPRARTMEILQFLLHANLVSQEGVRFQTSNQGTHLEHGSPYLLRHHTNWRLRAIQAAEDLGERELMYTVNVALSESDFALLREDMIGFIKEFLARVYPSKSEMIACFNLDWFQIRK